MDFIFYGFFFGFHSRASRGPVVIREEIRWEDVVILPTSINRRWACRQDLFLGTNFRARNTDYANVTRFECNRSHMAAAANHRNNFWARWATFFLSNILPMCRALNIGPWADIEFHIRLSLLGYEYVRIFSGGLFTPRAQLNQRNLVPVDTIGGPNEDRVGVPTEFYKIACFKYPNSDNWDVKSWRIPNLTEFPPNTFHTDYYTNLGDLLADIPVHFYDVVGTYVFINDRPNF